MDGSGRLHVRVYTSQAQIPVAGATVAVTGAGKSGKRRLFSIQKTDQSGEIKRILVDTPDKEGSITPGTERPYTVVDVWAEHPGFAALVVEGVQIFPGIDTVQDMELIPLEEGRSSLNTTQVRLIPEQTL